MPKPLDPDAQKLFAALVRSSKKYDVLDVIRAATNLMAAAIGQYAVGQGWDEDTAVKKALEFSEEVASMVKQNWGRHQPPRS